MSRITLNDIKQLYRTVIIPFHQIERDITLPLPNHRPDTDAEHSWALAVLAISLVPEIDTKLDIGLVSIFAVVHDVVEVYAGDTSVWADKDLLASKKAREATAQKQLKAALPQFPALSRYISAYETHESNEAKFVYALDKFIGLLSIVEDEGHYYHTHKITRAIFDKRLAAHRTKAHSHPQVAQYYDELRELFESNPGHFYTQQ
jgi:5'-deoxynucleotidase YfbR-like HD superfamily hydrolase